MARRLLYFVTASILFSGSVGVAPAAAASPDGATVYRQRCAACHGPTAAGRPNLGPSLAGVVGRRAAATPFNYSAALKKSRLNWTRVNLDRYLASPQRAVPGTRMTVTLSDAAQRQAVIAYLSARR